MEFTHEKKIRLRDKIEKMTKNKEDLINIKNILKLHNPELCMTKNSNGYIIDMSNLTLQTYVEINKFINKIENKKNNDSVTESESESVVNNAKNTRSDENVDNTARGKLKCSNSEAHILNRINYEKDLKKNQSNTYNSHETENKNANSKQIFKKQKNV